MTSTELKEDRGIFGAEEGCFEGKSDDMGWELGIGGNGEKGFVPIRQQFITNTFGRVLGAIWSC
jgi:hypothetical protein